MADPFPTAFTSLVGCRLPVQQAGMGGVTTPALAAAVARAGGLGMVAATGLSPRAVVAAVGAARELVGDDAACIGANFLAPFLDLGAVEAASSTATLVECFYGDPSAEVVGRIHAGGTLAAWQVGSRDEAVAAVDTGCDVVIVQGVEAGGHVRGTTPLLELLPEVRGAVDVPLVAAGGIGRGDAAAAAFDAGADAVRIGTLLLATHEADVHPAYVDALVRAGADDTVLTEAFSLGWPHAPHRVLRGSVEASNADPTTRSPLPPTRSFAGDVAASALYAGTSVGAVRAVEDAEAVVRRLIDDARSSMRS